MGYDLEEYTQLPLWREKNSPSEEGIESCGEEESNHLIHFEGTEKNLELDFIYLSHEEENASIKGCRKIKRTTWDEILALAKCQILSVMSNDHLDAYVLSESSLFVYEHKILLKTCGTTTLLTCLPLLLDWVEKSCGMTLEWLCYSRKNYVLPASQPAPHASFNMEVQFLKQHFQGSAYVLGPLTCDHWLVFVWDNAKSPNGTSSERTLHLLMQDLDPSVAKHFYISSYESNAETNSWNMLDLGKEMSDASGITQELFSHGYKMDAAAFEPCGYSMNAVQTDGNGNGYATIHITPESHCSYASWETNSIDILSYASLVKTVLSVFQPKRFTMTLYADQAGWEAMKDDPFQPCLYDGYKKTNESRTYFEGDYTCFMGNWRRKDPSYQLTSNPSLSPTYSFEHDPSITSYSTSEGSFSESELSHLDLNS